MDPVLTVLFVILGPLLGVAVVLLLLYGVVRVAVARGMRDHQLWMEKNRPKVATGESHVSR